MAQLAKGHVTNWFGMDRSFEARTSFEFARTALLMVCTSMHVSYLHTDNFVDRHCFWALG